MKNGFEPSNIYSFSCRIRIRIQNWTKTTPKPDFDRFLKNPDFYKDKLMERNYNLDLDGLIKLDKKNRELITKKESLEQEKKKISKIFNEIKPNIVYLPFKEDVHTDHKKIFEAAYSCTKSFRYSFIKKIYIKTCKIY